ncbi:MAG: sialidase family protein [Thiomonas sp.]|uniref:sialidase family protein n=1 Tax=Thiomonas sp. TaxID=2047785 RepID=UPI002A36366A|nr:sialidase family protein [Thiomonas sp.]MDY0330457.1 sialidase family protein [Thiomonas sp.]
MKPLFSLLAAFFVLALTSCSALQPHDGPKPVVQISSLQTGTIETYPAVMPLSDGQNALLYDNKEGRVTFQIGEHKILLDEKAPVQGGNWFQLHEHKGRIYASWWSHQNAKNLYITSSVDGGKTFGPVAIVNDNHGVLPPYTLSFGADGVVMATYSDERTPKYEVYFNRSTDNGLTWQRPDVRLDEMPAGADLSFAVEPRTLQIGKELFAFWDDSNTIMSGYAVHRVLMRTTRDEGKTWSTVHELYRSSNQISSLQTLAVGNKIILAFDDYHHGIKSLVSPDAGKTWLPASTLEGTETTTNSGITLATDGQFVYAAWNSQQQGRKTQIDVGRVDLTKGDWIGTAQRVDVKAFNNTDSGLPTIAAFQNGPVVVAWVDFRDIRPNIYVSMSVDHGAAWSKPEAISAPGKKNLGLPKLYNTGNGMALSMDSFPSDRQLEGEFTVVNLDLTANSKALPIYVQVKPYSEEQKQKMLDERVNELWKLRMESKYAKTYGFFDFAYRAFMPKKDFVEKSGNINYYKYEILKTKIDGNVAEVEQKVTYDSKPIMLPNGKTVDVKKTTVGVKTTWVWVGDNWYLVYAPAFGKPILNY